MSDARDDLFNHIASLNRVICGEFCGNCTCAEDDESEAERLIDAYAHELAEKIRRELKDPNPLASVFRPFAGTLAADLIDPEVPSA